MTTNRGLQRIIGPSEGLPLVAENYEESNYVIKWVLSELFSNNPKSYFDAE